MIVIWINIVRTLLPVFQGTLSAGDSVPTWEINIGWRRRVQKRVSAVVFTQLAALGDRISCHTGTAACIHVVDFVEWSWESPVNFSFAFRCVPMEIFQHR